MSKYKSDMTYPPDLHDSSNIGPVRHFRPVYQDSLPPCNHACPAGENIQAWLALAQAGEFEEAWQVLIENNPLPACHGRVCYHPCENACNRGFANQSVSIHAVERFLGDEALKQGWKPRIDVPLTGKKILIIGSGPAGLSCAWHLRKLGHDVEIREAKSQPGGMLRYGIPAYRMPRDVLDNEIQQILNIGVKLTLNTKVDDIEKAKKEGGFDAVFIAIGAQVGKSITIPQTDTAKNSHAKGGAFPIIDAVDYLNDIENGNAPKLGNRVAVYGGGNTAMDASRTALRLGAKEVIVIYRRDRTHMPAHDFEATEAIDEGVKFYWQRTINSIEGSTLNLEKTTIDDQGKAQATGEFETLQVDSLILALGQDVDTTPIQNLLKLDEKSKTAIINNEMMTSCNGIFAGGDMVPSQRTVTISTGHGKKAARNIDRYLSGSHYKKSGATNIVHFEDLHLWYDTQEAATKQPELPLNKHHDFAEILGGLTAEQAQYEAARCYSCGNCYECDGCYGSCPEQAVIKLGKGHRYQFNYDKCTGCQACYKQCPCHAIQMYTEESAQ